MHPFQTEARSVSGSELQRPELMSGPYWNELRTFLAVAKTGSVSAGAEQLGVSRGTVKSHIRRIEDVLQSSLIVTSASGVTLTAKGRELANALARVDRDIFAFTREVGASKGAPEGVVRVGCPDGLGLIFVTPALKSFSARFPKIQIHLNSLSNYRSLRENSTDCIIAFSPEQQRDITNITLGRLHLVTVASKSYIREHGMPTRDNLDQHYFIDSDKYSAPVPLWQPWQDTIRQGRTRHFSDNAILYAMMVKAGLGIGLLATYTLQDPEAVAIDIGVNVTVPLYAVFLSDRLETKPVAAVRDWIVSLFSPDQRWFGETKTIEPGSDIGYAMFHNL